MSDIVLYYYYIFGQKVQNRYIAMLKTTKIAAILFATIYCDFRLTTDKFRRYFSFMFAIITCRRVS